jgi:hypothetical protein
MSNPEKQWYWGIALSGAMGDAVGNGIAGAVTGAIAEPPGLLIGGAIGVATGLIGGLVGEAVGYWLDEQFDYPPPIGSVALYSIVVSATFSVLLFILALNQLSGRADVAIRAYLAIGVLSGFLTSASRILIDDLRYGAERRRRQRERDREPLIRD